MDSEDHATEPIDGQPDKTVGCISPPFFESCEDCEGKYAKINSEEEAMHNMSSPATEFRNDSSTKEVDAQKLIGEEHLKMSRSIIDYREESEILAQPRVSFRTHRDSPTPEISCAQHTKLPKPAIRELDNDGGTLLPILSPKRKIKKGSKIVRPSVFERLARTETVAFIHQKFYPVERPNRPNRSTSAPPLLQRGLVSKVSGNKDIKTNAFAGKTPGTKDHSPSPTRYSCTKARASVQRPTAQRISRLSVSSRQKRNGRRLPGGNAELRKNISTRVVVDGHVRVGENGRNNGKKVQRPLPIERFKSDFDAYNTKSRVQKGIRGLGQKGSSGWAQKGTTGWGEKWTVGCKGSLGDSFYSRRRSRDDESIDSYDIQDNGPPLFIEFSNRTKIICSNKYAPELGFEDIDPQQLGIRRSLTEYEAGGLAAKKLASEIMHALLWRDLPKGLKWNINFPLERELAMPIGEVGYSFFIEATEIKDESDDSDEEEETFHTASATGNVAFLPDRWEIHVENYSCVHNVGENKLLQEGGVDV